MRFQRFKLGTLDRNLSAGPPMFYFWCVTACPKAWTWTDASHFRVLLEGLELSVNFRRKTQNPKVEETIRESSLNDYGDLHLWALEVETSLQHGE